MRVKTVLANIKRAAHNRIVVRSNILNFTAIALTLGYASMMYFVIQPSVEIANLVVWSTSPLLLLMCVTILLRNHRAQRIMATLLLLVGITGALVLTWGAFNMPTELNLIILFLPTYQIAFLLIALLGVGLVSAIKRLFFTQQSG